MKTPSLAKPNGLLVVMVAALMTGQAQAQASRPCGKAPTTAVVALLDIRDACNPHHPSASAPFQ
jgi:hypothetical protein